MRDRMARHNLHPDDVSDRLKGRHVRSVGRRGKFMVIEVDGDLTWVIHLGMSGRLRISQPPDPYEPHTNFVAVTDAGVEIRFIDPRTFGFVAVFTPEELARSGVARLGPDAFEALPSASRFGRSFEGRSAPIKATLLNQSVLAGLGNIYADEALHLSRVRPTRPTNQLSEAEIRRLRQGIGRVLAAAIRHGGTSLDDMAYLLPDGRAGDNLIRLAVYGRTGEACRRCGTAIERVVVAQRSSHFCPACQI